MSVCVSQVTVHLWRSEANFADSVFPVSLNVGSGDQAQAASPWSHLTGPWFEL